MAELDEIVQHIMLDGDQEVLEKLKEVGKEGAESFAKINEASEKGLPGLNAFADSIVVVGTAFASLATAVSGWIDVNSEAIQKTNFLGEAFGASAGQIAGIEAAFAAAGVSTQQFEQFAQRLTVTIAREWPAITEAVRTAATEQDSANERVRASILRIVEAQNNLALVDQKTASSVANAALAEEQAMIKLQFAAQEAYSTMIKGIQDVQGANLGLEAAEQRLATLQGSPPSDAEKQDLQLREAQLAVDKARQAQLDALRKQQEEQAEAALKQQKAEQEAADARLKHETAINEAAVARQKAELAVREAITAREEAEERAAQQTLKNIPQITAALRSIVDGNRDAAKSFDFADVSVQNLVKSVINLASAGGKEPTGLQVMHSLMDVLSKDTDNLISHEQRLAIVQQLSQRGFNATGQAAFELLNVVEKGGSKLDKFADEYKNAFANSKEGAENISKFRDALVELGFAIDIVNRNFAASAAPYFTKALTGIKESLESSDGLLHHFADGIAGIGKAFIDLTTLAGQALSKIDELLHLPEGSALKAVIFGLIAAVSAFATSWVAIPVAIAGVIEAVGYLRDHMQEIYDWVQKNTAEFTFLGIAVTALIAFFAPIPAILAAIGAAVVYIYENWDKIKKAATDALDAIVNNRFTKWLKDTYDWLSKIVDKFSQLFSKGSAGFGGDGAAGASSGTEGGSNQPSDQAQAFATGGHVRGPGTGTSDSIPAFLSDGEYVIRSAAVGKFGVDFFHALNNMTFPGFATGGLVGAPARVGSPGNTQASRPLNLTIDGRTFNGLRGPKNVVDDLASYAVSRQTSSAGTKPSWVK